MIKFSNYEDILAHLEGKLIDNICASLIADVATVQELMSLALVCGYTVGCIDIDNYEYDKEYYFSLSFEADMHTIQFSVEKAYNYEKSIYLAQAGYVLVEENVPAKFICDSVENEYISDFTYEIFTLDWDLEDESEGECECCGCDLDDHGDCGTCEKSTREVNNDADFINLRAEGFYGRFKDGNGVIQTFLFPFFDYIK